jgi:hypothetical protein
MLVLSPRARCRHRVGQPVGGDPADRADRLDHCSDGVEVRRGRAGHRPGHGDQRSPDGVSDPAGRAAPDSRPGLDRHRHDLRHGAATDALTAGVDIKVVQEMLGHSSSTIPATPTPRWCPRPGTLQPKPSPTSSRVRVREARPLRRLSEMRAYVLRASRRTSARIYAPLPPLAYAKGTCSPWTIPWSIARTHPGPRPDQGENRRPG